MAEYIAAEMTKRRPSDIVSQHRVDPYRSGQFDQAEAAYRDALKLQPATQAAVNLADLPDSGGRDGMAKQSCAKPWILDPRNATAHHALGLLLIRQKRLPEALSALAEAAHWGEDNPRYGYVYAVAL